MGYRSSEFVHISRWNHSMLKIYGVSSNSGYLNYGKSITFVSQGTAAELVGSLRGVAGGNVYSHWMVYDTFPPETEAEQ
jgi:hypothetical protein